MDLTRHLVPCGVWIQKEWRMWVFVLLNWLSFSVLQLVEGGNTENALSALPLACVLVCRLSRPPKQAFFVSFLCWLPCAFHVSQEHHGSPISITFPLALGLGIGLSEVAVYLIRRLCGQPLELVRFRHIVGFLAVLLITGSLLNLLLSSGVGLLPAALLPPLLLLILVPVGLSLVHPARAVWQPRLLRLALPLLLLGALSCGVYHLGKKDDEYRSESQFSFLNAQHRRMLSRDGNHLWFVLEYCRVSFYSMSWNSGSLKTDTNTMLVKLQKQVPAARSVFAFEANDVPLAYRSVIDEYSKTPAENPVKIYANSPNELIAFVRATFKDRQVGFVGCHLDWGALPANTDSAECGLRCSLIPKTDPPSGSGRVSHITFAKTQLPIRVEYDPVAALSTGSNRKILAVGNLVVVALSLSLLLILTSRGNGNPGNVPEPLIDTEESESRIDEVQRESQQSLERVSGGVAHEFNTLLTQIQSEVESAKILMPTYAPSQKHISRISRLIGKSTEICEQLAASMSCGTRIEQPCNLAAVVPEICDELREKLPNRAVIEYEFPASDCWVRADRRRIERMMRNLLRNAAESYRTLGGLIRVTLEEDAETGKYGVRVQDFGCGIPESELPRVLEPFYSTKSGGRGLGLSAVLGIAKQHDGSLHIESQVGLGTTVRVVLGNRLTLEEVPVPPTARIPIILPEKASGVDMTSPTGTAIVAEDDPTIRDYVQGILESRGWSVLTAENGWQAVQLYREHSDTVSLIVLDLLMPVMAGNEAIRQLRELGYDSTVIVMSAYSDCDLTSEVHLNPNIQLLQKPFRPAELLNRLTEPMLVGG